MDSGRSPIRSATLFDASFVSRMMLTTRGASKLVNAKSRQAAAARRALESVERAQTALAAGVTADAVLTDVEQGLSALGELTGASIREDVTARIFERFCVGK